jgi:2,4-dienoyl-CoA reductase (NADPH2)
MLGGVQYQRFDDEGLHILLDGQPQLLPVDNVVVCAGQEPNGELAQALREAGRNPHVIGGADVAAELDAKRAIAQGTRQAMDL